jgi:hypothetical protein
MGRKAVAVSLLFLLLLVFQLIINQPAFATENTWSYSYYGPCNETGALDFAQTPNGSYVILAYTQESFNSERSYWLLGIDANGAIEWNKTIPLSKDDFLISITATIDGGFALAGQKDFSSVNNNLHSLNGKGTDFWLIKTDKHGNFEWNNTYGGSWHEAALVLVSTNDGGYALAGYTWSFEPSGYWLVKTDCNGTMQWSKSYACTYGAAGLTQTSNGEFLLVGSDGSHVNVVKVDRNGLEEWSIGLGESQYQNQASSIVETDDGGAVILGNAYTGFFQTVYSWLSKVDSTGNQEWFQIFDGNLRSLAKTSSGGFVLAGNYNSSNCLVKTDTLGNIQWVKPLGNLAIITINSVIDTTNGFVVAGSSSGPTNGSGVWVMRTDGYGNAPQEFSTPPVLSGSSTKDSQLGIKSVIAIALVTVLGIAVICLLIYRRHHLLKSRKETV